MANRQSFFNVNPDMPAFVPITSFGGSPSSASPSAASVIDWISDSDSDSLVSCIRSPSPSPPVSPARNSVTVENVSLISILTRAASRRMAAAPPSPAVSEENPYFSTPLSTAVVDSTGSNTPDHPTTVPAASSTNSRENSPTPSAEAQVVSDLLNFSIQELPTTVRDTTPIHADVLSVNTKEATPTLRHLDPYTWFGAMHDWNHPSPTPRPVGLPPKTFSNGSSSSHANHDHGLPTPDTATSSCEVVTPVETRSPRFSAALDDDSRTNSPVYRSTDPEPIIQAFAWRESVDGSPSQNQTTPFIPCFRSFAPDRPHSATTTECPTPVIPASHQPTFGRPPQVHFAIQSPSGIMSSRPTQPYSPTPPPAPPRRMLPERPVGTSHLPARAPRVPNVSLLPPPLPPRMNFSSRRSPSWGEASWFGDSPIMKTMFVPPSTNGSESSRARSTPSPRLPPPPAPPHPTSCHPLPPIPIPGYSGTASERVCRLPDNYIHSPPSSIVPPRQSTDATFGSPMYLAADTWGASTFPSHSYVPTYPYRYPPPQTQANAGWTSWGQVPVYNPIAPTYTHPQTYPYIHAQTHPRFSFSDGTVTFSVQHKDYRVHRYFFEQHSSFFKEMLSSFPLNYSDPIVLSASQIDFERLLAVFYPANLAEAELTTVEEWTSVLTLATLWDFKQLRTRAIKELTAITSPVERIILSRQHNVKEWPLSAYKELCLRGRALSLEEGDLLGMKTVIKIWETETELRAQCKGPCCEQKVTTVVKAKFGLT